MNLQNKIFFGILVIGIIFISSWWILNSYAEDSSIIHQLCFDDSNRFFTVGFPIPLKEGSWGTPIPKYRGEDIYNFRIESDIESHWVIWAKIPLEKKDIRLEDFAGKQCFFTGYSHYYRVNHLIKENPNIGWLALKTVPDLRVFEIEQMIPVEDNDSVLVLDTPDSLSRELEISVTVRNTKPLELVDTILSIAITHGPFEIIAEAPAHSEITSSTYYSEVIENKYDVGEEKTYDFKIKRRRSKKILKTDFEISVSFGGYGIEGDSLNYKIDPLYSKEVRKYRLAD